MQNDTPLFQALELSDSTEVMPYKLCIWSLTLSLNGMILHNKLKVSWS